MGLKAIPLIKLTPSSPPCDYPARPSGYRHPVAPEISFRTTALASNAVREETHILCTEG